MFGRGRVQVINIVGNSDLEGEYIFRIPVVTHRGNVLAEGRVTRGDLKRARSLIATIDARDTAQV
jgi:hypothetical protein